jgi:DNA-binding HxlR family transcriptional regulator
VMALLDLLGRRWALRVLWELREERVPTFRELQARCGNVSSSVLSERLRELRAAGILAEGRRSGYALSSEGRSLLRALAPLDAFAREWASAERAPSLLGGLVGRDREDDVPAG